MVFKLPEINTFLLPRKALFYFESTILCKTQASMWQIGYCEVVYAIKVINSMNKGWLHFQTDVETFHILDSYWLIWMPTEFYFVFQILVIKMFLE